MKKEKGFTLVELLAVIVILGILAIIIVPSVANYVKDTKSQTYTSHENTMINSAKSMMIEALNGKVDFVLPTNGQSKDITLKVLEENEFIKELDDPAGGVCSKNDSFVRVTNNSGKFDYTVCLHCGTYVTDNPICS